MNQILLSQTHRSLSQVFGNLKPLHCKAIKVEETEKKEFEKLLGKLRFARMASLGVDCLPTEISPVNLQKIIKEGILLVSGGAAILLQVANPRIAQIVSENSNFAKRPLDRLRSTMTYMYCSAFGTPEEKRDISARVNQIHQQVNGPSNTADDAELQLWVGATLYVVGVDLYQRIFGELDEDTADNVYRDYSVISTSLRVPPEMWPETRQGFLKYWDEQVKTLEITSHARDIAKDLLFNESVPLWIRVNLPIIRLLTAEWLPAPIREGYGLKMSRRRRRIYRLSMGLIRKVYPNLSVFVREYPVRYYLKGMRKQIREEACVRAAKT